MQFVKVVDISVVMACYNSAQFIDEAIRSILSQTFSNFEFIIIDDASTDGTRNIIENYVTKDSRIVFHSLDVNSGPAVARNVGIAMARGKWIAILDSDDVAFPNRLELQIEYVESRPGVVLLGSACIEADSDGISVKTHQYPSHHSDLVERLENFGAFFPHSSSFYLKDLLKRIGNYNQRFVPSEDYDLWLRLSEVGHVACVSKPLIRLRRHQKSISNDNRGRTQTMNGVAAGVCHLLRQRNALDPSTLNNSDWFRFVNWLAVELEQRGYFHKTRFHYDFRQVWYSQKQGPFWRKGFELTKLAVNRPGHFIRIAWDSFFGFSLPAELTDEWMQRQITDRNSLESSRT